MKHLAFINKHHGYTQKHSKNDFDMKFTKHVLIVSAQVNTDHVPCQMIKLFEFCQNTNCQFVVIDWALQWRLVTMCNGAPFMHTLNEDNLEVLCCILQEKLMGN